MGKSDGPFSPKSIANKIKAKGLQKLRWYCQMCEKQCRDENGFKCHCMSESHRRMMQVFRDNPGRFMNEYSREFEKGFVDILSRRHSSSRVHANVVYNEFIADRHHTHMNSTVWTSLREFIKYLGRKGIAKVEETEKGWYLEYISRDPHAAIMQEEKARREKADLTEEERTQRFIEQQREIALQVEGEPSETEEEKQALERSDEEEIKFGLKKEKEDRIKSNKLSVFGNGSKRESSKSHSGGKRKRSELEEVLEEENLKREKLNRKDYWLQKGIIVKFMNKKVGGGSYYKKKGVITELVNKYVAMVEMLDSGDILKVDQADLETVIPNIGGKVRIVNGAYRGDEAVIEKVDFENYSAMVKISKGPRNGKVVKGIQYEDICKLVS